MWRSSGGCIQPHDGSEGINEELPERSLGCFLPVPVTCRKPWRFLLVLLFFVLCILTDFARTSGLLEVPLL